MDLRKRLSTAEEPGHGEKTRSPWGRWILFTGLILLLAAPFILDFNIPGLSCNRGNYRAASAVTGTRLPDIAAYIFVGRNGTVRVSSGEEMSLPVTSTEELQLFINQVVSEFPKRAFVLRIDKEIPYEKVNEVLTVLEAAGVHDVFFHTVLPDPR